MIIAGEKGTFDLADWLLKNSDEQFGIAAIAIAELWHGVERVPAPHKSQRENYLRALVGMLPIIPYTEPTVYHHARLWAELDARGKMIGTYDLIVAATALEPESTLVTFNQQHFANVRGVKVIEPQSSKKTTLLPPPSIPPGTPLAGYPRGRYASCASCLPSAFRGACVCG